MGKYGIYSFNGNKIITTSGGGMIVSDDVSGLEKVRFWATQARDPARHYQHSRIGYNYRLSNILAGIGRGQLRVLDGRIKARRAVFDRYYAALAAIPGVSFMPEADFGLSTRWLTTMTIDRRLCKASAPEVIDALAEEDIEARPVWKPLHLQPLFSNCEYYAHSEESVSDHIFESGICLPSGSSLSQSDQERIIDVVRACLIDRVKAAV